MSSPSLDTIINDLRQEQASLDDVMVVLAAEAWELPTPSPGWAIRDQIGHLAFFDRTATLALEDPEAFVAHREEFYTAASRDSGAADEITLSEPRAMNPNELLDYWRHWRSALDHAARQANPENRIEWYGPSMGIKSFLTARLMECWAHGQDICDTVGAHRRPTERLRHIAQLGYITRAWTYLNRRLDVPEGDVRVELSAPSGEIWAWGPEQGADGLVTGSALDFCLVTSQRRNVADTDMVVSGETAIDWLNRAQLFAGPPSDPPKPAS